MGKTAVLIHGLHLQAHGWESVVWGDPEAGIWGVIPRGVEYAWRTQSDVVVWGSGASEKDGKKEAELMYELALDRVTVLATICHSSPGELADFLTTRSVKDIAAKDTTEELKNTFNLAIERGITDIVSVPPASAAPITARKALSLSLQDPQYGQFKHRVMIAPSDTRYEGGIMEDIVIFAPPHRGDRVANPSHVFARKTLDVLQKFSKTKQPERINEFLTDWEAVIKKYSDL